MSTPRGKIGRLSALARGQINALLRDNRPASEIQAMAASYGVKNLTPQNVSAWKKAGYQEWLRRQERLEEMASRREFALDLARRAADEKDPDLLLASNAAAALAVDTIQAALEDFDATRLKELLAEKPAKFMQMIDSLAALRKGDQAFVRLRMEFEKFKEFVRQKAAVLEELAGSSKGATADDLRSIAKELYGV